MRMSPSAANLGVNTERAGVVNDDDEVMDIDDPRVPDAVRSHGMRFEKPARFVADLDNGELVLYAADGELLDLVYLN